MKCQSLFRNLLSFEVKLPLNHPMFKELHTNMFLWTQLPEFKLGNLRNFQVHGFMETEPWVMLRIVGILKKNIKCDSNGLFATLTLNAFPSSYSHYAKCFQGL